MAELPKTVSLVEGRECGSCSLCCKIFNIDWLDKPKPAGKWCHNCVPGKGCQIWQSVPQKCADFFCSWRLQGELGDEWRPDRAGFVINKAAEHLPFEILVDPGRPDAWRKEPYYSALKGASMNAARNHQALMVIVGLRRWFLLPDNDVAIPTEHFSSDYRIYRESALDGGRWQVRFLPAAQAS
jgi:hypothetical protein